MIVEGLTCIECCSVVPLRALLSRSIEYAHMAAAVLLPLFGLVYWLERVRLVKLYCWKSMPYTPCDSESQNLMALAVAYRACSAERPPVPPAG